MGILSSKNCRAPEAEEKTKTETETVIDLSDTEEEEDNYSWEGENAYWHDDDADGSFEARPRTQLTWRGDPEDTLSDWKIVLHYEDSEEEEKVYHVHRNILALGERGCDYFATLFRSDFSENQGNTSHIHLKSSVFDVFEDMLSFIYLGKLHMCHHIVLPLQSLARYFGNQALQERVNKFLGQNLTPERAIYYLKAASDWGEESLFHSALRVCAERFMELDIDELNDLPLDLFRAIVTCPDLVFCANFDTPGAFCECDKRLSYIVSNYLKNSSEEIVAQDLVVLTENTLMKRVEPEAASHFMSLVQKLEPGATEDEKKGMKDLCYRCWQSNLPTSEDLLKKAKEFVEDRWDDLEWNERELLMQLGHSLKEAEEKATRSEAHVAELESNLQVVKSQKRCLEDECIQLRRIKRRLSARLLEGYVLYVIEY